MRIGKFFLGIAGLLLGLLIGEAVLRLAAPQVYRRPRVWEFDERLGWRHIPGASGRLVSPEFSVEVAINRDGLRDRDYPRSPVPGSWRLLAFGDSFVEGWGVSLEASVSKQLENRLQAAIASRPVEVINFGVAGYGTDQELLLFEELGQSYQPDEVLVFFYANDFWNNAMDRGIGAERGYKPYFRLDRQGRPVLAGTPVRKVPAWDEEWEKKLPLPVRLDRYLRERGHLYSLLQKTFRSSEMKPAQVQQFYEGIYGRDLEGRWQPLWELTGRLLEAFEQRVRRAGARMLLIYVPAIVQIEEDDWATKRQLHDLTGLFEMEKPNRQLASFAARYDIRFLDLSPAFKEAAQERTLYLRDSHWNEKGHALAAELIADFLLGERSMAAGGNSE